MIDLHTHTPLCGHASGEPEEYVQQAIKKNLSVIGFSDHAPLPEHLRKNISMQPEEVSGYMSKILDLKKKYQDKIEILLGFELDYPIRSSFDTSLLTNSSIDYFICSVHYLGDWPVDNSLYIEGYGERGVDSVYQAYYKQLLQLAQSGTADIIGHFDLPKKYGFRPERDFNNEIREIAKAAKTSNTTVEINTAGLRKLVKEIYPSLEIIQILSDEGVCFTLGSDAHKPTEVGYELDLAAQLLKKYGIDKISAFRKRERFEIEL